MDLVELQRKLMTAAREIAPERGGAARLRTARHGAPARPGGAGLLLAVVPGPLVGSRALHRSHAPAGRLVGDRSGSGLPTSDLSQEFDNVVLAALQPEPAPDSSW